MNVSSVAVAARPAADPGLVPAAVCVWIAALVGLLLGWWMAAVCGVLALGAGTVGLLRGRRRDGRVRRG